MKQVNLLSPIIFYIAAILNLVMMANNWREGYINQQLVFNAVAALVFLLCGTVQLISWYRRRQRMRRRMEARRRASR